jgi:hypothetical protein
MSSISGQNFSSIDDDYKEISLSKETDFKTEIEILDAWISLNTDPNDMNFSHTYILIRSIRSQSCRSKKAQTKEI